MKRLLLLTWVLLPAIEVFAEEINYDVVPKSWVTHNGKLDGQVSNDGPLLIFPSRRGQGTIETGNQPCFYTARDFLARGNHIAVKGHSFCVKCNGGDCRSHGSEYSATIHIRRLKGTRDLCFEIDPSALYAINTLDWANFRRLQSGFERWLWQKAAGFDPTTLLWRGRSRFNHGPCSGPLQPKGVANDAVVCEDCYKEHLTAFWQKVVGTSTFDSFRKAHLKNLQVEMPEMVPSKGSAGPSMGAIPLMDGMQLAIYWGGVASYSYPDWYGPAQVSRQTTEGCYRVGVVTTERGLVLDHYAKGGPSNKTPLGVHAVLPRSSASTAEGNMYFLPFGVGETKTSRRKLVPIDCLTDLYNPAIFQPTRSSPIQSKLSRANITVGAVPHLTLLIPCEYTKADNFAVSAGATRANVPDTTDALAERDGTGMMAARDERSRKRKWLDEIEFKSKMEEKMAAAAVAPNPLTEIEQRKFARVQETIYAERRLLEAEDEKAQREGAQDDNKVAEGNWTAALRRRFILWASTEKYDRRKRAPEIPVGGANSTSWANWDFMPMVFGNQTTVEVEVPVFCNGKDETRFVYHSWLDCLPKELAIAPEEKWSPKGDAPLRVTRTAIEEREMPEKSDKAPPKPIVRVFRFHTISATVLRQVSVYPNDSFQY